MYKFTVKNSLKRRKPSNICLDPHHFEAFHVVKNQHSMNHYVIEFSLSSVLHVTKTLPRVLYKRPALARIPVCMRLSLAPLVSFSKQYSFPPILTQTVALCFRPRCPLERECEHSPDYSSDYCSGSFVAARMWAFH